MGITSAVAASYEAEAQLRHRIRLITSERSYLQRHIRAMGVYTPNGHANFVYIAVGEARAFVAALRKLSKIPVVYAELPRAQRAFDIFGSPRARITPLTWSASSCPGCTRRGGRQP